MTTLRGFVPKFRVYFRPADLTDPTVPHSICYDALKNSEPLTQAFEDRGTIVFTTALCPYLPSMSVVQLLIIEILCFSLNVFRPSLVHPIQLRLLYCIVLYSGMYMLRLSSMPYCP